MHIARGLFIS